MRTRSMFAAVALMAVVGVSVVLAAKAENDKCPLSGKAINASKVCTISVDVGFCCNNCKGKYESNPSAYTSKIAGIVPQIVNDVCPMSGRKVDPTKVLTIKGEKVAFCCGNCCGKAAKDKAAVAGKIKRHGRAGNDKCIFSGKDVKVVAKANRTIGFCCGNCQKKFVKDPAAVLKKLK